jgi:hypothetical protein
MHKDLSVAKRALCTQLSEQSVRKVGRLLASIPKLSSTKPSSFKPLSKQIDCTACDDAYDVHINYAVDIPE